MTKEQKNEVIELLKGKFSQYNNFYITDTESLTVAQVGKLRRACFNKQVEMKVAKNTSSNLKLPKLTVTFTSSTINLLSMQQLELHFIQKKEKQSQVFKAHLHSKLLTAKCTKSKFLLSAMRFVMLKLTTPSLWIKQLIQPINMQVFLASISMVVLENYEKVIKSKQKYILIPCLFG